MGTGTVQSGMASDFFAQFIAGEAAAATLLPSRPLDPEAWDAAAARAGRRRPMQGVVEELQRQASALPGSPARSAAIAALARPGTTCIVTGQQVGIFLGPLYTLHKAATAVARARWLVERTGCPCIPVFWLQTEDHDWAEVAHFDGVRPGQLDLRPAPRRVERRGPGVARPSAASSRGPPPARHGVARARAPAPRSRGGGPPRAALRRGAFSGRRLRGRPRGALRRRGAGPARSADPGHGRAGRAADPLRPRGARRDRGALGGALGGARPPRVQRPGADPRRCLAGVLPPGRVRRVRASGQVATATASAPRSAGCRWPSCARASPTIR